LYLYGRFNDALYGLGTEYAMLSKKRGVSHCEGSKFVCNDGSYSRSKKSCSGGLEEPVMENGFQYLPLLSADFSSYKIYMYNNINMIVVSCWKILNALLL
jgi:hypothetical protein